MRQVATINTPPAIIGKHKIALYLGEEDVLHAIPKMTEQEFDEFCLANPNLRLEQDPHGNITILMPSAYHSGWVEAEAGADLGMWNRRTKLGKVFSPSTLFKLPDGSKRMPDAAWVPSKNTTNSLPRSANRLPTSCPTSSSRYAATASALC